MGWEENGLVGPRYLAVVRVENLLSFPFCVSLARDFKLIILLTKITESITGRKFEMLMVISGIMEVNSYKPLPKVIPLFCLCCFFFSLT